ncbi:MAG TPA: GNAT family N-acetyltransferase [Candidatus Diapherotrites archaeon]|nr:GNAT family N-acetyltransferase [Candidatus Diapherotrites archaeon]
MCYREKELVGAIFGNLQRVSQFFYNRGYKIEAKPKDYMFSLTEFFVKPGNQKQGIGTKLMARVIADQRARYNSKFVYMIAYSKTHNINQKLTGKKPFIVPISRTQNTNIKKSQTIFTQKLKNIIENLKAKKEKKVYRNFKHSRYKYDLVSIKEYKDTHYNYIVTKKNPKYKRKQIKRRNTIRRSVAK